MLCFWGLTVMERRAYIRRVGRVAGRPGRRRNGYEKMAGSASRDPVLEAHRQRTLSYRHDRLNRQRDPDRRHNRDDRATARKAAVEHSGDGQEVRRWERENSSRPPLRAVSGLSRCPATERRLPRPVQGPQQRPRRPRAAAKTEATRNEPRPAALNRLDRRHRDDRTDRPRAKRGTGNESSRLERVPNRCFRVGCRNGRHDRHSRHSTRHGARARHG